MKKVTTLLGKILLILTIGLISLHTSFGQIAAWDVSGVSAYGASPFSPTTSDVNTTITGLTRGSGVAISGTAAGRAWGGLGWNYTTATNAVTGNAFFTFTVKANTGYQLSLSSINPFDYRRSSTGATNGLIQYQINSGVFVDISTVSFSISTSAGGSIASTDLSSITELQNIPATTTITFRIVPYGASASTGTFYIFDKLVSTASDFSLLGTVSPVASSPFIAVTPTNLTGFTYVLANGPSAVQSFAVSGSNLTNDILIALPTNYELSLSNAPFTAETAAINLVQSAGTVASTTIYARLKAGLTVGAQDETINLTSIGATAATVACTGSVTATATPTVIVTPATLTGFTYVFAGGPSAVQSFAVSGADLTNDISIAIPVNYELSLSNAPFTAETVAIVLTQSTGTVANTTIYARLKAGLTVGAQDETINVTSTGATAKTVACTGSVTAAPSVASVSVAPLTANINQGGTTQLTATVVVTGGAAQAVSWTSSDIAGKVTVSATGLVSVTADATPGNYTITATSTFDANQTGTATITVVATTPTIFTETLGTVSATTTIVAHETANGFDFDQFTMTNGGATLSADIRATSVSSTYAGASGLSNAWFPSTSGEYGFAIEGIDASLNSSLAIQFGYRKESSTTLPTLNFDYWNGSAWINVPFTFNEAATAATGWYLSPTISLPVEAQINNLKIRWVKSGTIAVRLDDIKLTGNTLIVPTLTIAPTVLNGFTYVLANGPSSVQTFTVSGTDLTNDIAIALPVSYELSLSNAPFSAETAAVSLTQISGTVVNTTIYTRLKAGLLVGNQDETINITSSGATAKTVTCTGSVTAPPTPVITVTPATLTGFTYVLAGGPSSVQSFTVSGVDLTTDILISLPANYEISLSNSSFVAATAAITLTQSGGIVAITPIYVRLKQGLVVNSYNEDITATASGAVSQTVACSGSVAVAPSTANDIVTFNFSTPLTIGTVDALAHTVSLTVPFGTVVAALIPTITTSVGATISPASDVAQDFTNAVQYSVTAQDGTTTQIWTVTVTVASQVTYAVTFNVVNANGSLSASVDGNTIASPASVIIGKDIIFTATPDPLYRVKEWRLDGALIAGNVTNNYTLINLSAVATVTVEFEIIPVPYTVTFTVTNSTPAPIAGATIIINSQTLTTDASGIATIDLLNGTYAYTIAATGYNNASGNAIVNGIALPVNVTMTAIVVPSGQLIISQYIETSAGSTPKGIELWNKSGVDIDFATSNLVIKQGTNGATTANEITVNTGTLANNAMLVIGSDADVTGIGTGFRTFVEGNGATFITHTFTFNGDDALEVWLGGVLNDVFGTPGTDPGTSWAGSGVSTQNQNISLIAGITSGSLVSWTDPSLRFSTVTTDNSLSGFGLPPVVPGPVKFIITDVNGALSPIINQGFSATIQTLDANNNPINANTDINFTIAKTTGSGILSGTTTGTVLSGTNSLTVSGLLYNVAETGIVITVSDNNTVITSANSNPFDVLATVPVATQLVITSVNGGVNPIENTSFNISIETHDANNIIANVTADVPVTITIGTGTGILSGNYTGTILSGTHSVTISGLLYNPAEQGITLVVSDNNTNLTSATSAAFDVIGLASQLAFVTFPTTGFSNTALTTFTAEARNTLGQVDLSYAGNVTINVLGGGTLNGTLTKPCTAGVATFNDIAFPAAGTYQLEANSGTLTVATSVGIVISDAPAVASQLVFTSVPASGLTAVVISTFTVEARSAGNVLDPAYTGNVTISKVGGTGTMGGTLTQPCISGIATFNDITFSAAGTYNILAVSGTLTNATSTNIVINAPILVTYPTPFDLSTGDYSMTQWDNTNAAGTYPANMIFHKASSLDPGLTVEMTNDYAAAYNLTTGTRINGLGVNGFSFTNTSTAGYLGAAILALNTTGKSNISVSWNAGTSATGAREYRIRLQYMIGTSGVWTDLLDGSLNPIEYTSNATSGHSQVLGTNLLPVSCENEPIVMLRWKDYFTTGTGTRPTLSIDEIFVTTPTLPVALAITDVNGGNSPVVNMAFDITVKSLDANNLPSNVSADVNFTISRTTGTGNLTGTSLSGTIAAGTNTAIIPGLQYDVAETGVSLTAADDALTLTDGISALFDVTAPPFATSLAITDINGGINPLINAPFTVTVQLLDNFGQPIVAVSDVLVTLNVVTGTGNLAGSITGTILTGTSSVIISGSTYDVAETGVVINAVDNASILTDGLSNAFTVTNVATALHIVSVNGGIAPIVGIPFDIIVESVDANNQPVAVTADVNFSISLSVGTGVLGGTLSGIITAGNNTVTITGITYSIGETGVIIAVNDIAAVLTQDTAIFNVIQPVVLQAGDIAIVQYRGDAEDGFAFVVLTNIGGGTQISFTDNACSSMGIMSSNEQTMIWEAPTQGVLANTVVTWQNATGVNIGTIISGALSGISANGDQIIAYTGSITAPTYLYALSTLAWITTGVTTNNNSYLPTGLVDGYTAISFNPGLDNAFYQITPIVGLQNQLLYSISDTLNWTGSDDPLFVFQPDSYWDFTIGVKTVSEQNMNISVYPNPAKETFNVGNVSAGDVMNIFDISGRKILSTQVASNGIQKVDCAHLTPGCYILAVNRNGYPIYRVRMIKN